MKAGHLVAFLLVAAAMALSPSSAQGPETPCRQEAPRIWTCAWQATFGPGGEAFEGALPAVGKSTLEVRIRSEQPTGFRWYVVNFSDQTRMGFDTNSNVGPRMGEAEWRWTAFYPLDRNSAYALRIVQSAVGVAPTNTQDVPAASWFPSDLEVKVLLRENYGVVPAARPAGSPADPHLVDPEGDAPPGLDLLAAWFDDPILDDGLFTMGLAVSGLADAPDDVGSTHFHVEFRVLEEPLRLAFRKFNEGGTTGWVATLESLGSGARGTETVLSDLWPHVSEETGILLVEVPEMAVGEPPADVPFTDLRVRSFSGYRYVFGNARTPAAETSAGDEGTAAIRTFALGGPEVWDRRDGRLTASTISAPAPWYEAPLSPDNLADTLQVSGAAIAAVTFLAGLLLVRRRRERLARLLDDVDAILDTHRDSPAHALSELDALERRFDRMHREGTISQGDHTALMVRIERAGYRLVRGR